MSVNRKDADGNGSIGYQFAVAYPLGFFIAQACALVIFVFGIGTLEVEHFGVAFESQDVGTDAVEKPTVVADDHGTARIAFQTFFQRTQGVDVDVVGGFIEEQYIGFRFQIEGQVQAVAFSTGQHAGQLFLIAAGKIEFGQIRPGN